MSMTRKLPNTDGGRMRAADMGMEKKNNTAPADIVFSANTQSRLDVFQPDFKLKMQNRDDALVAQTISTRLKNNAMAEDKILISDFIQTFNAGVKRGLFPKEHRAFYHLDVNSESVPPLTTEADVMEWGGWLIDGDPRRIAAGGAPMAMPTIAEVAAKHTIFMNLNNDQSTKKDAYDTAQEAVQAMRPEADALILRMWNEVETAFDNESIESRRRNAREWGVVYVSTTKSNITGTVKDFDIAEPLANVNVTLIETGDTVRTDATGFYKLSTGFVGTGNIEFSLEGYAIQTLPLEIAEGSELTLDIKLKRL